MFNIFQWLIRNPVSSSWLRMFLSNLIAWSEKFSGPCDFLLEFSLPWFDVPWERLLTTRAIFCKKLTFQKPYDEIKQSTAQYPRQVKCAAVLLKFVKFICECFVGQIRVAIPSKSYITWLFVTRFQWLWINSFQWFRHFRNFGDSSRFWWDSKDSTCRDDEGPEDFVVSRNVPPLLPSCHFLRKLCVGVGVKVVGKI